MSARRLALAFALVYAVNFLWLVHITVTCPDCQEDQP